MIVKACAHSDRKKHGKDRKGQQRYKCRECGRTWTDAPRPLLSDMRIPIEKAELALTLLMEGNSILSASRITGLDEKTIARLMLLVGQRCKVFLRRKIRNVAVRDVQVDEIWGFVGCKQRTAKRRGYGYDKGDAYTFIAFERESKLVLCWHLGKRNGESANAMMYKLSQAAKGRYQLTTDGFREYSEATFFNLPLFVDYAQLVKIYGGSGGRSSEARYSPAQIIEAKKKPVRGNPKRSRICTSHVERQNLNIRMSVRRMTRLTNGFSKKWGNHEAATALYLAYYNFCRVHGTIKTTPAVESGLVDHQWTVRELIEETATY